MTRRVEADGEGEGARDRDEGRRARLTPDQAAAAEVTAPVVEGHRVGVLARVRVAATDDRKFLRYSLLVGQDKDLSSGGFSPAPTKGDPSATPWIQMADDSDVEILSHRPLPPTPKDRSRGAGGHGWRGSSGIGGAEGPLSIAIGSI